MIASLSQPHRRHRSAGAWLAAWTFATLLSASAAVPPPVLRTNDVVALVGGAGLVAAERSGAVETLLTLAHPGHRLRFRTLAWEGDTVFERPRDPNFPSLTNLLARVEATVVALQFGALESFEEDGARPAFRRALEEQLTRLAAVRPGLRPILVTPPPFESKPPPLPDLAPRNEILSRLVEDTRDLAAARGIPVIDLFHEMPGTAAAGANPWTFDGRELSPAGHRCAGAIWMRAFGRDDLAVLALRPEFWNRPDFAALHEEVGLKNRYWFDYWRPMNWAFLHGDRTEQPSSRDHRDPRLRWFPTEIERFVPLIAEAETRIDSLAAQVRPTP